METFQSLLDELDPGLPADREGSSPLALSQPESSVTQVIPRRRSAQADERNRILQTLETELLEESISVSRDTLRFREIAPDAEGPPQEWIDECGEEKAAERFRVAQAGWMTRKNAPVGVQIAMQLTLGIMKSRATKDKAPQTLNVQVVQLTAPIPVFPELELESGET